MIVCSIFVRPKMLFVIWSMILILISGQPASRVPVHAYLGIFDEHYYEMITNKNVPFENVDILIVAFGTLNKYGHLTNLTENFEYQIKNISKMYRKVRPDGKILIASNYDRNLDEKYILAASKPLEFAQSVKNFIDKYDLDGYDMDWETGSVDYYANVTTILFAACRKVLGDGYILGYTIIPNLTGADTILQVEPYLDYINFMCYGDGPNWIEGLFEKFSKCPRNKIVLGIASENNVETQQTINHKVDLARKGSGAVFEWRIDNDPNFSTIKMIEIAVNSK